MAPLQSTPGPVRTRVKICGITRQQDALAAVNAGADAIGLVFYPPSPRAIDAQTAAQICRALPPLVDKVGLFVNASVSEVEQVLAAVPLSLIQFHGDETPEFCEQFGKTYIKAVRLADAGEARQQALDAIAAHSNAAGVLIDSYKPGTPGGTGTTFDWSTLPDTITQPIILAGGLSAENVSVAIDTVQPYAVDVSSGVEAEPGIKDSARIDAFMRAVGQSDHAESDV